MMPLDEARDKMIRGPKRHESVGPVRVLDEAGRRAAAHEQGKPGEQFLLAVSDEGLGVGEVCLDRGQSMSVQRHAASQGEFIVVPRGVEHRPVAEQEVEVMLFEPAGVLNTGNVTHELTAAQLERI